jgi:hypothetical protein
MSNSQAPSSVAMMPQSATCRTQAMARLRCRPGLKQSVERLLLRGLNVAPALLPRSVCVINARPPLCSAPSFHARVINTRWSAFHGVYWRWESRHSTRQRGWRECANTGHSRSVAHGQIYQEQTQARCAGESHPLEPAGRRSHFIDEILKFPPLVEERFRWPVEPEHREETFAGARGGHAPDEACGRGEPIVGAQHRRSEPGGSMDIVVIRAWLAPPVSRPPPYS